MMFEVGAEVFLFLFCLLSSFHTLIDGFGLVGGGVNIHDMNVVNTVCPLHPEVSEDYISLHPLLVLQRGPFEFFFPSTHGATCVDVGIVTYVSGGEGLARKVGNSIMQLIMTRCDEAPLLSV